MDVQMSSAKVLTEFLGTLFLCLTVALVGRNAEMAPLAIGLVLMVAVYAGGHVSGGHYNPAVTLSVLLRGGGKINPTDAGLYVVGQLCGALCGALLAWALVGKAAAAYPAPGEGVHPLAACLCEVVITFALCCVVISTATTKAQAGNSHFGLAIGATVLSGAAAVGGLSGGAFNPAVGSMPLLYGAAAAEGVWIYWLSDLLASLLAAAAFRAVAARSELLAAPPATLAEAAAAPAATAAATAEAFAEVVAEAPPGWPAQCAVELAGTALLSFTVGTALGSQTPLAPLAIGSMLMVMIYMGGWISGGHFNPAVTIAALCQTLLGATYSTVSWAQVGLYLLAQVAGAAVGTLAAWGAVEESSEVGFPALPASSNVWMGIVGEFLGAFLLSYVFLNAATVKDVAGNSYFGLAIGMVVTAMACAVGPVTGGAFNPAVGMMGLFIQGRVGDFWIYWLACSLGAMAAAACFRVQNYQDFVAKPASEPVDAPLLAGTAA